MPKVTGKPKDPSIRWSRKDVVVQTWLEKHLPVNARVLGNLAVHEDVGGHKLWSISCINTGCSICVVKNEVEALKIAEVLFLRCNEAFACKSNQAVQNKLMRLAAWAEPWLWRMEKVKGWIDPEIFEGNYG